MENKKADPKGEKDSGYVTCNMCGREFEVKACSWQEDDGAALKCHECWAEQDNCGCSD